MPSGFETTVNLTDNVEVTVEFQYYLGRAATWWEPEELAEIEMDKVLLLPERDDIMSLLNDEAIEALEEQIIESFDDWYDGADE